jgi:hypothetical protein
MFQTQVLYGWKLIMAGAKEKEETGVEDVGEVVLDINENKEKKNYPNQKPT